MADSYTTLLGILKMETGSHVDDWGTQTNTNWDLVDHSVAGRKSINVAGGNSYTLSTAQGVADEARYAILEFTGALTSNISVIVVSASKQYLVRNSTTGAFSLTVKCSGSDGQAITQANTAHLWCDGTTIRPAISKFESMAVSALSGTSASFDNINASVALSAAIASIGTGNFATKVSTSALNAAGNVSVDGLATFGQTVSVSGAATFKSGVSVSGTVLSKGAMAAAVVSLTDGASIAVNFAQGNVFQVTLAGNRTLETPTNINIGMPFLIYLIQDATGNRTLSYSSVYKWEGGVTAILTSAANAVDALVGVARTSALLDVTLRNDFK